MNDEDTPHPSIKKGGFRPTIWLLKAVSFVCYYKLTILDDDVYKLDSREDPHPLIIMLMVERLVGIDDAGDELVAHNILLAKIDHRDALYAV